MSRHVYVTHAGSQQQAHSDNALAVDRRGGRARPKVQRESASHRSRSGEEAGRGQHIDSSTSAIFCECLACTGPAPLPRLLWLLLHQHGVPPTPPAVAHARTRLKAMATGTSSALRNSDDSERIVHGIHKPCPQLHLLLRHILGSSLRCRCRYRLKSSRFPES